MPQRAPPDRTAQAMDQSPEALRKLWRRHCDLSAAIAEAWAATGYQHPPPHRPTTPEELRGLCCGARTRAGTPCKLTSIYRNGRCKLHGGLSTGPTTPEGKARCALNGMARKRSP